jgi:hypothetical protein
MTVVSLSTTSYGSQVILAWDLYRAKMDDPSATANQKTLVRNVLWIWLNRCNVELGQPTVAKPYPDPPAAPAIETTDATDYGPASGNLVYA